MPDIYKPLPPAFVPVAVDTTEMFNAGRTVGVTHHQRSGDVNLCNYSDGSYISLKFTRDEAQALLAELQRVLALPTKAAA
ncbi:hypothetical protein HNP55_003555 [Paucibacter oligotrophus]|uniref:Uncharacterized protein n=1 Tax=Roseateles oligotrophus TaxID=1769250 RepID=A0A840LG43_9BURK|nr:hypothetical protein [Roseateles oligotrophus]MBB4845009.1 hypothetical protein [Roseateles oligotrophus]